MIKPDWDTTMWNPWKSDESEQGNVVVIDNETVKMPHAIRPLIQSTVEAQ